VQLYPLSCLVSAQPVSLVPLMCNYILYSVSFQISRQFSAADVQTYPFFCLIADQPEDLVPQMCDYILYSVSFQISLTV
jgi:hypothetical protein